MPMPSDANAFQKAIFDTYTEPKSIAMFHKLRLAAEKADAKANALHEKDWLNATELEKKRWFKHSNSSDFKGQQGFANRAKQLGDHFLRTPYSSIEGNHFFHQPDASFRENLYLGLLKRYANRGWSLFKSDPLNEPNASKASLLAEAQRYFMNQSEGSHVLNRLNKAFYKPDNTPVNKNNLLGHNAKNSAFNASGQPPLSISHQDLATLANARQRLDSVTRYLKGLPDPELMQNLEKDLLRKQPWRNLPREAKYQHDDAVFKIRHEYWKATGQKRIDASTPAETKALPAAINLAKEQKKPDSNNP